MDRSLDIEYVNEHREALGHEPLPLDLPWPEVQAHLDLIDKHAPYGQDPWAKYD